MIIGIFCFVFGLFGLDDVKWKKSLKVKKKTGSSPEVSETSLILFLSWVSPSLFVSI